MSYISKSFTLSLSPAETYKKFIHEFNQWWPSEYTWSQELLEKIIIEPKINGLCSEFGPNGFRCDWGTVIDLKENQLIQMLWQISAKREPLPNPAMASEIKIEFLLENNSTCLSLQHYNFENHGGDGDHYRQMMDSEMGWDYILLRFRNYCQEPSD